MTATPTPPAGIAALANASPADLAEAAHQAVERARAGFDRVRAGGTDALSLLDEYDEAVAALLNTADAADLLAVTHPDAAMREAAEAAKQVVSAYRTGIGLDPALYAALAGLALPDDADAPTRHYLARILREFRRNGVDRDSATRDRVRQLRDELTELGQQFERNIHTDHRFVELPAAALSGLPEDYVRSHPADDAGMVRVGTDYPDLAPILAYCADAGAREQLWRQFRSRGHPANIEVLHQMLLRRHELATLLGYPNWAQYAAEDKMVATSDNIADFIERIASASAGRGGRDYEALLQRKRVDEPEATEVHPWDAGYLTDRIKAERFTFDSQQLRPYFEYEQTSAGLIALAERLFGIRLVPRTDIIAWHPLVRCHDVLDAGGQALGRIYLDMHPRPDKYSHAAVFPITTGKAGVRLAECALVCNLPEPGEQPALMVHQQVQTFLHEFGHLLHFVFAGGGRWAGVGGMAMEWDFVEAPSQLLEEWVRDGATLAAFARHHSTGEVLPEELVTQLRAADEFGKGLFVRQQMFLAALSHELHRRDPKELDPVALERELQHRYTPYHHVEGTYLHLGMTHLEGYSALYYTYMWSLVIAKDLFTAFTASGLGDTATAARYRRIVLSAGGSAPAAQFVADFLGRPYSFAAYQAWLDQ